MPYSTPSPFPEDHGTTSPDPPEHWSELTDAQYHVLLHAHESSFLWDALAFWVLNKDGSDWDNHGPYAGPLIAASRCLLQWDLITLWRSPHDGEGEALPADEALRITANARNWLATTATERGCNYELTPSEKGKALGIGPPRPGESRTVRTAHELRRLPTHGEIARQLAGEPETP